MAVRAWDVGRSERRAVMARIRVETSPDTKVRPRPTGLTLQENLWNRDEGEKANDDSGQTADWCVS